MSIGNPLEHPPTVAVAAIAFDAAGRVLLVRRRRPPAAGQWSVPGGKLDPGETLESACARELREETGLLGHVIQVADVVQRIGDGYHYVIIDYLVDVVAGQASPGSDAAEVGWFAAEDLDSLDLTDGLLAVIDKARALR